MRFEISTQVLVKIFDGKTDKWVLCVGVGEYALCTNPVMVCFDFLISCAHSCTRNVFVRLNMIIIKYAHTDSHIINVLVM